MADGERHRDGMAVRRRILGEAHVDRAEAAKTDLDRDFQAYITETAWGSVWTRPHLTDRERQMLVFAILAARGHLGEVALHARAIRNTGVSEADLAEVMMVVACYAGVPAANAALAVIKKTLAEEAGEATERAGSGAPEAADE